MRGLEALLKVAAAAEDRAHGALAAAVRDHDAARVDAAAVAAGARAARDAVQEQERGACTAAVAHRRYVDALAARAARCRARVLEAKETVDGRAKAYREARHRREAVGGVIAARRAAARKIKAYREERELGDAAQRARKERAR